MNLRFSVLLGFLLVVLLLLPAFAHSEQAAALLAIVYSAMLLSGVIAIEEGGWLRAAALALAVPAIGLDVFDLVTGERHPSLASIALDASYLTLVGGAILRHILRREEVTHDLVLGGTCVYLFIGVLFAQGFAAMELVAPGSFRDAAGDLAASPSHAVQFTKLIYFSFVSLTTLGYGDVTPVLPLARAVASVEAVVGQLYLAIFIGSLVGLRVATARRPGEAA